VDPIYVIVTDAQSSVNSVDLYDELPTDVRRTDPTHDDVTPRIIALVTGSPASGIMSTFIADLIIEVLWLYRRPPSRAPSDKTDDARPETNWIWRKAGTVDKLHLTSRAARKCSLINSTARYEPMSPLPTALLTIATHVRTSDRCVERTQTFIVDFHQLELITDDRSTLVTVNMHYNTVSDRRRHMQQITHHGSTAVD